MEKRRRSRMRLLVNLGLLSLLTFGPGNASNDDLSGDLETVTFARIERFGSAEAFDDWARAVHELRRAHMRVGCGGLVLGCASQESMDASSVPVDESITNTQEDGVDEGGIVKAAGEYFVILRRGRLFTVRQDSGGADDLVAVDQIDAYPKGWTRGAWYDEMLIHGDRIVVVGFSYSIRATEIGLFRLGADGGLTHEATHFLRSNDYFSSRNYASRLVDGQLVFYMPYRLFSSGSWGGDKLTLPSTMTWVKKNKTTPWDPILAKEDIYTPVQGTIRPSLHTVVHCDLEREEIECSARAVVGPGGRTFHVTRDHVYLWVGPPSELWSQPNREQIPSYLYRMPLGEGEVGAAQVRGMPIDQFSFRESADGHINVVLANQGSGDWMWSPEFAGGDMALLRLPLEEISPDVPQAAVDRYTIIPAPAAGSIQNRFVGDHVLWASSTWSGSDPSFHRVFLTEFANPKVVSDLGLDHQVERIEVLGDAAMVIGARESDLLFSSIMLEEEPFVVSTYEQENAVQGETRSHGFFYRPSPSGGGLLGLPIRHHGSRYFHLLHGSAEVRFLSVDKDYSLKTIGALAAADEAQIDDACRYSCVDWYGNARPIFYRGRIFALMGYEMVEGGLSQGKLEELRRLNFFIGAD